MMKKLTKAALLAAATAFLLAGMTACFTSASDVDDDPTTSQQPGDDGQTPGDGSNVENDALKKSGTFEEDITKLNFTTATAGLTDNAPGSNGKYVIKDGTTLADGYFKIVQSETSSTTYYTDSARTKINAIELDKQSNNTYIEFTVTGSAEVTVSAASTSGSGKSYVDIVKAGTDGTFDTATEVSGSTATEVKKTCTAGTYRIVVVTDTNRKSAARITSIKAVQTVN